VHETQNIQSNVDINGVYSEVAVWTGHTQTCGSPEPWTVGEDFGSGSFTDYRKQWWGAQENINCFISIYIYCIFNNSTGTTGATGTTGTTGSVGTTGTGTGSGDTGKT
jgi:hypothetical protein